MSNCTSGSSSRQNTTTASILLIPLSTATLVLNLLSLSVLLRSKKLRKSKFLSLLLSLSINNVVVSFASISIIAATLVQMQCINIGYVCLCLHLLTNTAMSCSLLQVLFICIERLVATFSVSTTNRWSRTYTCIYTVSMLITAGYVTLLFVLYADHESSSCRTDEMFAENYWLYKLLLGIKRLIMIVTFSAVYSTVVVRLKTRMKKISPLGSIQQNAQLSINKTNNVQPSTTSLSPTASTSAFHGFTKLQTSSKLNETTDHDNVQHQSAQDGSQPSTKERSQFDNVESSIETNQGNSRAKRFRQSMVTLVMVIIATSVCVLPSIVTNMLSALTVDVVSNGTLEFTNIFIVLNPLIDPIVYVLRIKDFRDKLKCRKP